MLRKAGLIDNHPCADPDKYHEFRSLSQQYQEKVLDHERKEVFNKLCVSYVHNILSNLPGGRAVWRNLSRKVVLALSSKVGSAELIFKLGFVGLL